MPMCNLRHCRRRSGPCFLHFPSLSPKNLIPVVSTSKCSTDSARAVLCRSAKPNRFLSVQQNWIAASEMLRTASAFATCRGKPAHALVQPPRQRASSFEGCVVLPPVAGSIAGVAGLTHAASLPLEEQRFMQQRPATLHLRQSHQAIKKRLHQQALCDSRSAIVFRQQSQPLHRWRPFQRQQPRLQGPCPDLRRVQSARR